MSRFSCKISPSLSAGLYAIAARTKDDKTPAAIVAKIIAAGSVALKSANQLAQVEMWYQLSSRFTLLIIIKILFETILGYPVVTEPGNTLTPPKILDFMRQYGYLEQTPADSETLYHETAIKDAIINIQKFGALNMTGILDAETLHLMTKPRCGVPDMNPRQKRSRRYVIGSKRWQKRNINYFIANWSPKVGEEKVVEGMQKAFNVWAIYSNLRFKRVYDPSADIIVAFGARYHGDGYPFDGPGNILAHAFYPYEMQSYGGDVHFDDDENWKENSTNLADGVDFYSVAVHELGHSLGLAHSPIYSSIMFPYYKGPDSTMLDFDDILAMYELYIKAPFEDDEAQTDPYLESDQSTEREDSGDFTTQPTVATTASLNTRPTETTTYATTYEGDYDTIDNHQNKTGIITTQSINRKQPDKFPTRPPRGNTPKENVPNICTGNFSAVAIFRGDIFIFKKEYVWRLTDKYRTMEGYPIKIKEMFSFLPEDATIDAAYERNTDNSIVLFTGPLYWVYDGYSLIESSPCPIVNYGIPSNISQIDAAMFWPKNQLTYLFSGDKFWRYNEATRQLDEGYPRSMRRWIGIPNNIDAATAMPNGKTYFFKGNLYWLYNNTWIRPERGYPRIASNAWFGCPLMQRKT